MSEQQYHLDQDTKDCMVSLIKLAMLVAGLQQSDTAEEEIKTLVDTVCNRFDLVYEETEYNIETLDNGDIMWRKKQTSPPLTLVSDNTKNDSDT